MSERRVLLYVQHLLGIGHFKRAMTLARTLGERGLKVTVANGGFEVPELAVDGICIAQLPPVGAADLTFKHLIDASGAPIDDEWKRKRREALLALYRNVDPQILLIELFPFGRRQMRFELLPLLDMALQAAPRPLVVSSTRDIGGGGQRELSGQRETVALVERYFDHVLVHSDPLVIPFDRTFPLANEIERKLQYTGFLVEREAGGEHNASAGKDEVIVSAGGGAVGRLLLETALRARCLSALADRTWRVLTGINAPVADAAVIKMLAERIGGGQVIIERVRADFTTLLRNCAASVSQAGYNTMMEILDAGTRAVIVPFAGGAETEQTLRATVLAERGLIQVVEEPALTPAALAAAIDRAANGPSPKQGVVDLGGARRSAMLLERWAAERAS